MAAVRLLSFASTSVVVMALAACGGSEPEPKAPEPEPEAPVQAAPKEAPVVQQELGSIDDRAVRYTFTQAQEKLLDCQKTGLARESYLAGEVRFFVRVGGDGRARYAYLEDSTLGDRDSEKCMIQVVMGASWPKPEGGEAEVRTAMTFDAPSGRAPDDWSSDQLTATISSQGAAARKCKQGVSGTFRVTAYIEPAPPPEAPPPPPPSKKHGKKKGSKHARPAAPPPEPKEEGRAISVGVAAPNHDADAKVDCIVDAVKAWTMPSPGSFAAKVTFPL